MPNATYVLFLTASLSTSGGCRLTGPDIPVADGKALAALARTAGQPFWKSTLMANEPVLFVQEAGQPVAAGRLLFVPSAKPTIQAPDLQTTYEEGRDYLWHAGSSCIVLSAGSRIPFKTSAEMVPPPGSPNTLQGVLFFEGRFFHDLQVQVSYPHAGTWPLQDPPLAHGLARSRARLESRQPLHIVALGDSITEGYNASGFQLAEAPPHQPAYPQLVADTLHERFGGPVTLTNLGRAGTGAEWGLEMVGKVRDAKPDLVLLAFGMNHSEPAPAFEAVMRQLRDAVKAECPGADVILVAPMAGNPRSFPPERFTGYRDALRNLTSGDVALADVTSPWLEMLKSKSFSDLSGNNINHPNDFGHRLYAAVVCELFPVTLADVRKS
ncbi:MAG: SGNH/GDSL hydrolase family protein [Planctomycetes bacterium]|nr:SGNH/GDSL hydrolase family protein [Planctomycetota bacterium]